MSIETYERATALLPAEMRKAARDLNRLERAVAEELRLRAGYVPTVLCGGREIPLPLCAVTRRDLLTVLEFATGASAHTAMDSIRRGFVTARGGFRVGLCGTAVMGGDGIGALRDFSSLSIRIPTERRDCADTVYPKLFKGGLKSVLLLSPPGVGKTTLLRELIRRLSEGGIRVAVADERGEVAAVYGGTPQMDVGPRTDILTGAPKAEAAMMLLRAMNPQILALDEITDPRDSLACENAANCGVALLATVHASSVDELRKKTLYRELLDKGIFDAAVLIGLKTGERTYSIVGLNGP